jgi:phosphohistidine phosphatase SixA
LERQLDAAGRRSAADLGAAWKALRIPIGEVWSSPTFRARETVRLAGLAPPRVAPELGDGGRSMQAAGPERAAWLRAKVSEPPPAGSNRLLVTHLPNLAAAFGAEADGLKDGDAMIFRPEAGGQATMLGRIAIDAWPRLVQR